MTQEIEFNKGQEIYFLANCYTLMIEKGIFIFKFEDNFCRVEQDWGKLGMHSQLVQLGLIFPTFHAAKKHLIEKVNHVEDYCFLNKKELNK